jgi:uncharacterized protein YndB with AHSA1/START domain
MKWLLIICGVILLLAVIIIAIAARIPQNHVASRSVQISAPPAEVWKVITDVDQFPSWRPGVARVERLPDHNERPSWREVDSHGQSIPYEVDEWNPPSRLVTRIADPKLPFGGTWTYEIQPSARGSVVRITERGEIYNLLFRFVARFFIGYTATMDSYLKALGAKFGDTVAPQN